jgi:hypothetical protein
MTPKRGAVPKVVALQVIIVVLAALLVLAVVLREVTPLPTTRPPTITVTTAGTRASTTPACDHPLSSEGSLNHATVYQITSSHAALCLNYALGSQGETSFGFSLQSWVQNGKDASALNPCQINQGAYECPGFTVIPSPKSATFGNSTEEIALTYTITASSSANGLYVFFIRPGNPIYLSFGQTPTNVFSTAWTSGTRLPSGVLPPSYLITGGTNVDSISVPWA